MYKGLTPRQRGANVVCQASLIMSEAGCNRYETINGFGPARPDKRTERLR